MSAPPHSPHGHSQQATAPPYPGGGVPPANSMYPTVQQGYPGISYTAQSSTTYNIAGNPPQPSAAQYPVQPGGPPAHSGQNPPYPTQPGQAPSYPTTPGSGGPGSGGPPQYPSPGGGAYPLQGGTPGGGTPYPSTGGPGGGSPYPSTGGPGGGSPYPSTGGPGGGSPYPSTGGPGGGSPYPSAGGPGGGSSYPSTGRPGGGSPYPSIGGPGGGSPYPSTGGTGGGSPYPSTGGPAGGAAYPSTGGSAGGPPYPGAVGSAGGPPYPSTGGSAGGAPYPSTGGSAGGSPYPNTGGSAGGPPYPSSGGPTGGTPYPGIGGPGGGTSYPSTGGPGGYPPYAPPGSAPPRVPPKVTQPAPGHQASAYPTPTAPYPSGGQPHSMPPGGGSAPPYPGNQSNVFGQAGHGAQKMHQQPGFSAVPQPGPGMDVTSRSFMPPAMKKALIVGCNYHRTSAELKGCINDAKCMKYLLMTRFGFEERNIKLLTDDQAGRQRPTKQYIVEGMHWLVEGAQPGSSLFFHFSGHGSQKRDYVGDEQDGFNETLLPTDYKTAGQIVDDDVNRFIVNSLGPGVTLHAVIDACHSGTAMDLKYRTKYKSGHWVWKDTGATKKYKGTKGGIAFQFGACKDSEVAQDTNDLSGNAHTGAATFAFIQAIETGGPSQSYAAVLSHMHRCLQESVNGGGSVGGGVAGTVIGMLLNGAAKIAGVGKQTPQLSCSERYDVLQHLRI